MSRETELEQQIKETNKAEVAYRWMTKKLSGPSTYVACDANAALLASYIDQYRNGSWTNETLDEAYEALKSQLVHSNEPSLEPVTPAATAQPAQPAVTPSADGCPTVPPGCHWPKTKAEIRAMPPDEYRSQYHNKRTGQQFRAYVNAILARGL